MTIYRQPTNLFVAGFLGSPQMNSLSGAKVPSGWGDGRIVGVRPHDLAPKPADRVGASDLSLSGELALIEPAGPLYDLDVQVAEQLAKADEIVSGGNPSSIIALAVAQPNEPIPWPMSNFEQREPELFGWLRDARIRDNFRELTRTTRAAA
jgi:ABC-type sugar transport system ATPase subunit